ncbi:MULTISPECIES: EamA family transporter [Kitasatospora]|uniref:Drug/metabolite transporter (DMT)-like permease n=2 Tax=Kitasatospora TaxID=2063 RepID=A0ABT1IT85_9ACTN|nr:DMT family transporter [Kitasatospora paracochleata]MCP2308346.1 drug/metabolite transporter (DMT)-like permease [Kitasatospora paracochleata]
MVVLVVLAAALLHAVWNALAHGATDKLAGVAVMNCAILGTGLLMTTAVPLPGRAALPYLACSAALQVGYQLMLARAYRLGDFGQMYPIARGTSPMVVALISVTLLGRTLPFGQSAGVLVISLGLAGLALAGGIPGRAQLPALTAALATGTLIAAYTVVDGTGVRRAASVGGYIAWMFVVQAIAVLAVAFAVRGRTLLTVDRGSWAPGLAGGVMSLTAYGLVVWAQSYGELATIAALRETSIVIAALIGAIVFRERLGRLRLAASATVLTGIAVLQLTHG